MAVAAAPHGRVPGCVDVEQGKTTGRFRQAWNSISLVRNKPICVALINRMLIKRNDVFVGANHVQARACGRLDGPGIVAKSLDFGF